jgi:hypothetical protein
MKRFIPFLMAILALLGAHLTTFAQNTEYYEKDTVRQQPRQTTMEIPGEQDRKPIPPTNPDAPLPILDRLRLGGSFGLGFGTVTNINLSPMVGLNLTDKLVSGIGATYMWYHSNRFNINSNYYGGRAFLMYSVLPMVTLQAEYEGMNVQYFNNADRRYVRTWIGSPLIGGAYTQPLGGRFTRGVHMTVLYNLNYQNQLNPYTGQNISPYSSPFVFRVTFL